MKGIVVDLSNSINTTVQSLNPELKTEPRVHIIKSIEIHGFLGQSSRIVLNMDRYANFIIGRNGAGKTTLINFVNAILSADVALLRAARFSSVLIKLKRDKTRNIKVIKIEKSANDEEDNLTYSIWADSKSKPQEFPISTRRKTKIKTVDGRTFHTFFDMASSEDVPARRSLSKTINELISVTWLSLHRRDLEVETDEDEDDWEGSDGLDHTSGVDRRLAQVFSNLTGYFYRLDAKVAQSLQEFQKQWFLSFLSSDKRSDPAMVHQIDSEKEKEALVNIFENFVVDRSSFLKDLDNQFKRFEEIRADSRVNQVTGLQRIAVLIDTLRLHYLVDEWQKLEVKKEDILAPKSVFVKICNQMLFRKKIELMKNNSVSISDFRGKNMPLTSLSSGEKQLLIFLSETLLQEGAPHIFLADEPELSLHVEWQEELVSNLLNINPNAQVIFATHSPDIISKYSKNVIKMESILK